MILRLWRGWTTTPEQSAAYERLLLGEIAPAILERRIPGLRELSVLRRDPRELDPARGGEVLTAMTFEDLDAVAAFTGGDPLDVRGVHLRPAPLMLEQHPATLPESRSRRLAAAS